MTPQKFKPGDKVGIVAGTNIQEWSESGKVVGPGTVNTSTIYTVEKYPFWSGYYNCWAVKLVGVTCAVSEDDLVPVLPEEALAELLEESLLQPNQTTV